MTQTITNFIRAAGISMTAERWHENPTAAPEAFRNADHWRCILRAGRSRLTVYFSKGYGHNGQSANAAEVLDCLASDASSYDNVRDFDDWCAEYGYNVDSRNAERTYKIIGQQATNLRLLLGDSAYRTLLYDTERL